MKQFVPKEDYDRVIELLQIIVTNMVCMDCPKTVAKYLSDCGFTDDELRNLVNLEPNDEIEPDDDDDENDYLSDYPELEPQDDRYDDRYDDRCDDRQPLPQWT